MMKIKKIKRLIVALCASVMCVLVGLGVSKTLSGVNADDVYSIACDLQDAYIVGDVIDVPEMTKITVQGTNDEIDATLDYVSFPNGIHYGAGTYTLALEGIYELSYTGEYNGETVTVSKTFLVQNTNWLLPASSSVEYGDLAYIPGSEGLKINLKNGDMFLLNEVFDLNEQKLWNLGKIYPDIRPTPETCTVTTMAIRLIDVYDESNYLDFCIWTLPRSATWSIAGASNQKLSGLESSSRTPLITYEGAKYHCWYSARYSANDVYGGPGYASSLQTSLTFARWGGANFSYEPQTNKIYFGKGQDLVTDVDAPEIYADNLFKGFTTGEVRIGIQCYNYSSQSIYIEVEELMGLSGNALKECVVSDVTKPVVEVVGFEDTNSVVGALNEPFAIPAEVSVTDMNYRGAVKTDVYYNYYTSESPIHVSVKDGAFIPKYQGVYSIVYSATDVFGNVGTHILDVIVGNEDKAIEYAEQTLTTLVVCKENVLPAISATGLNGDVTCEVRVTDPKGGVTTLSNDLKYVPEHVGKHKITYIISDKVYVREFTYELETVDNGDVYFKNNPLLPNAFIKGAKYSFEEYFAYTASENGAIPHATTMEIAVDNGAYQSLANKKEYTVTATDSLKIKYSYNGKSIEVVKDVVDINYTQKTKNYHNLFVGNYTSVQKGIHAFSYTWDGNQTNATLSFANLISLHNFSFNFYIPVESANFTKMSIVLQDGYNLANRILVSYEQLQENSVLYRVEQYGNGRKVSSESKIIEGTLYGENSLIYSNGQIKNKGGLLYPINVIEGDLCLLSLQFEGVNGETSVDLKALNNQKLGSRNGADEPEFYMQNTLGLYETGEEYVIKKVTVSSVYTPVLYADLLLTVTDPNGNVVKDKNGKALQNVDGNVEYTIVLSQRGLYKVIYKAKINTGNATVEGQDGHTINVIDSVAPVIKFDKGLNENCLIRVKVNETHKFAGYTLSDNNTPVGELRKGIVVYDSKGVLITAECSEYAFTKAGMYKIFVWCMDVDGNVAQAYYNVLVEAE